MHSKKSLLALASFIVVFVVALVTLTGFTASTSATPDLTANVMTQQQEKRTTPVTARKAQPNEPGRTTAPKRASSNEPCALRPKGCTIG